MLCTKPFCGCEPLFGAGVSVLVARIPSWLFGEKKAAAF
jgi:hypothetical protein